MRPLAYIFIALGIYLLVCAGFDEVRGITHKPVTFLRTFGTSRFNGWYLYSIPVRREQNPPLFRKFMVTHWIYAVLIESAGWILYLKSGRQNGN